MKQSNSFYDFERAFDDFDRSDNFSREGLRALYDYLEEYEDSTGEELELDVIAICCEFTEFENLDDFWDNYDEDDYPNMQAIEDNTTVIPIPGSDGFIIQDF